jgi:hypothetical protein
MEPRRRYSLLLFVLAIAACIAGGYLATRLLIGHGLPWGAGLPWHGMEALTGSQVIASTALTINIDPASGNVEGEATLGVKTPGGDGSQVVLLLNSGLDIDRITCEGQSLSHRRDGERVLVQLSEGVQAGELVVAYSGALESGNDSALILREDEFVADRLQFWYPVDLKSFSTLTVTAIVPEDFEVAWSGTLLENQVLEGRRSVRWEESRPVLAAGLAAGRFKKVSRVQGSIRCNIFGRELDEARANSLLTNLGDSYNYYHAQLGADGFNQLNLVISGEADGPSHLGGPTILCNPERLEDADDAFAVLAHQVARNWWGETVSGRWFSTRPEAGEWLLTGLSEYSAWQALRTLKGRRAYLRHQESLYCPPEIPGPMKAYNLERRLHPPDGLDERLFTVRGPYTTAMLAEYIGADAFARACRNFMSVHRYSTVSYAALLHEMSLASEKPLDELVRVWFDRPGTFDYGISSVTEESGRVHVTVQNSGDIPAYVPMELGLITEEGYQVQSIEPGVHGDTLSFTVSGRLKRVVLDPEFAMADMRRTNNTWPASQWPSALAVSPSGRIALLSQSEWGGDQAHGLHLFPLAGRAPEVTIDIEGVGPTELAWDMAGQQLLVQQESTFGIWRNNQWQPADKPQAQFLGWGETGPILWNEGQIAAMGAPPSEEPILSPTPIPGLSDVQPSTGRVAYVTDEHVLVVWEPSSQALSVVREEVVPAGGIRWRGDTNEIVYFEVDGALVSVAPDHAALTTLLRRNYPITQAKISEHGGRVAWVDPAGLLRALSPGVGEPVYISLPGEIVDFAWEGEDALVVIVAAIPRRLPMRFHADYTLWRIPATTWRGVQLPYNPVDFAKAASGTTALRQP